MVSPPARGLIVLDRDGTIIVERHYLGRPEEVELLPGAAEGIHRMRDMGFRMVVVTNQSGIARGYFTLHTVDRIHARMHELLDGSIDAYYVCPHHPEDACRCRKPRTELLLRASKDMGVDLAHTVVIGDKPCDIESGKNAGARTILVRTGYGAMLEAEGYRLADDTVDDLLAAADLVSDRLR